MFHSASLKLGLDRAVLAAQRQSSTVDEGTGRKRKSKAEKQEEAKEIDALLKKGAYDVFNDDDDTEAQQFMDTDIDQLLEKSSRTVTYGESATTSLASGLGSFSKASFVASTGDGDGKDVDLDDVSLGLGNFDAIGLRSRVFSDAARLLVQSGRSGGSAARGRSYHGPYHRRKHEAISEAGEVIRSSRRRSRTGAIAFGRDRPDERRRTGGERTQETGETT